MDVKISTTKTCTHCPHLERDLGELGIDYEVLLVDDHPEVARKHLRHSPNLVVDEEVVFRRQPGEHELREFLASRNKSA